ncbi:MAG: hypothetical protein ACYCTL_09100 [Acidimicrobiales bacterium]
MDTSPATSCSHPSRRAIMAWGASYAHPPVGAGGAGGQNMGGSDSGCAAVPDGGATDNALDVLLQAASEIAVSSTAAIAADLR